jgi:hypothetical protein
LRSSGRNAVSLALSLTIRGAFHFGAIMGDDGGLV